MRLTRETSPPGPAETPDGRKARAKMIRRRTQDSLLKGIFDLCYVLATPGEK